LEDDSGASSSRQASTSQAPAVRSLPSSDAQRAGQVSKTKVTLHFFKYLVRNKHLDQKSNKLVTKFYSRMQNADTCKGRKKGSSP